MRAFFTLAAILVSASAPAFADTWTGKLIDTACVEEQNQTCTPTASTVSFAIEASGLKLKLDPDGNRKAAEALKVSKNGADRAKDPSAPNMQVNATVKGTLDGDVIKVESVELR